MNKFALLSLAISLCLTPVPVKGIALADWKHKEDLDTLGASWYYGWGENCPADDARCVNMTRAMELPKACYGVMLVGNEPNAREPYGAPVTPADAVSKVKAIEAACPKSKLVIGNVSADDWGTGTGTAWLKSFLKLYGPNFKQALGVHCYTQHLASWCISQFRAMRRLYRGEMWVTEFGVLSGDAKQFKKVLDYVALNFTRYAAYTARQPHTGEGWEIATGVEMVNADGSLSPIGVVYRDK